MVGEPQAGGKAYEKPWDPGLAALPQGALCWLLYSSVRKYGFIHNSE
jgi:hypothetical protein